MEPFAEKTGGWFAQAETELSQSEILCKEQVLFLLSSSGVFPTFLLRLIFFIRN